METDKIKQLKQLLNKNIFRSVTNLTKFNIKNCKDIHIKHQFGKHITEDIEVTERPVNNDNTEFSLEVIALSRTELRKILIEFVDICGGDTNTAIQLLNNLK